jgi:hypothetical protein
MLKNIWCALFHWRSIRQIYAAGEWKTMMCDRCGDTWKVPR